MRIGQSEYEGTKFYVGEEEKMNRRGGLNFEIFVLEASRGFIGLIFAESSFRRQQLLRAHFTRLLSGQSSSNCLPGLMFFLWSTVLT